ncbi:uncharacterized protein LOC127286610 [Leptopilina boulardi]|uniref:uncharacterized protein LOC127286610 n=1 Tax=Leptopilina boulardi TaxID=63433 RepID=UPI0021F5907F|nr:uncharacterized protein LOC127286610 [Leptopilina boulardi]XP_051169058.1 uncharacterized protein LOC127286610 [Leptopilina boulardi]
MDTLTYTSPLATVQLIPIFNYLTILSDYLFINNYLPEFDQYKQIPIINALYDYLEENKDTLGNRVKLIRYLLKGSDLYGEEDNEYLDPIFVNEMFNYIISSLVFDKYGNIYGFLAETIRGLKNLQFDYVMPKIKEQLANTSYENEFGIPSTLSDFAVERIYHNIILPLFPQPNNIDINLLSLDYIFAQAGSIYLRLGRINETYFPDFENYILTKSFNNLKFDDFVTVGHIIINLLHRENIDILTLRAFALPVVFYYISTETKIINETIRNIIFEPHHWEMAYHNFLQFTTIAFEQIKNQLTKDYAYKIHEAFLKFHNRFYMAKLFLDLECRLSLNEKERKQRIPMYIKNYNKNFQCHNESVLPDINEWFIKQIDYIVDMYEKYDLAIVQQYFNQFLKEKKFNEIEIKLLVNDFNNLTSKSFDLLEFSSSDKRNSDYYALIRENYTVTFIKESDNPEIFNQKVGSSSEKYKQSTNKIVILKYANEQIEEFYQELMKYKKEKLKFYLNNLDNNSEWWKEFGLSLVPAYPCLSNNDDKNLCEEDDIKFLKKFPENITSNIIDIYTRSLLSLFGINIRIVFLKNLIDETIDRLNIPLKKFTTISLQNKTDTIWNKFSLHLEEPECESNSITQEGIKIITAVIDNLKKQTNENFAIVDKILNKMKFLKSNFIRNVSIVDKNENQILYIRSFNSYTGYGYKFIFTSPVSQNKTEIANLRSDYGFNSKMFIKLFNNSSKIEKTYIKFNTYYQDFNTEYYMQEINNHLHRKFTRILFFGISSHDINEQCDNYEYLQESKHSNVCLRHRRFIEKIHIKNEIVEIIKKNFILKKKYQSEEEIRKSLEKYTLPDNKIFLIYFVNHFLEDNNFEESEWSKYLLIENSHILNKLRFDIRLENNISNIVAKERINLLYTYRERSKIEEATSLGNIIKNYNNQKAGYSATFEDYYAIRNFITTGNRRISQDTSEAKLMKLALYKLAIRQSDDLKEDFESKLFRIEYKSVEWIKKEIYIGKRFIFQKFLTTSTNIKSAERLSEFPPNGFRYVLYEMDFFGSYFRVKIEVDEEEVVVNHNYHIHREKKVILLPGSEFEIVEIVLTKLEAVGNVLKVVLLSKSHFYKTYDYYKKIMNEISRNK